MAQTHYKPRITLKETIASAYQSLSVKRTLLAPGQAAI